MNKKEEIKEKKKFVLENLTITLEGQNRLIRLRQSENRQSENNQDPMEESTCGVGLSWLRRALHRAQEGEFSSTAAQNMYVQDTSEVNLMAKSGMA